MFSGPMESCCPDWQQTGQLYSEKLFNPMFGMCEEHSAFMTEKLEAKAFQLLSWCFNHCRPQHVSTIHRALTLTPFNFFPSYEPVNKRTSISKGCSHAGYNEASPRINILVVGLDSDFRQLGKLPLPRLNGQSECVSIDVKPLSLENAAVIVDSGWERMHIQFTRVSHSTWSGIMAMGLSEIRELSSRSYAVVVLKKAEMSNNVEVGRHRVASLFGMSSFKAFH